MNYTRAAYFTYNAIQFCFASILWSLGVLFAPCGAHAAILWDAEAGTHWWFDPVNWNVASNSNSVLPPSGNATGSAITDTQINLGSGAWDQGEGVVYDPAIDPYFAAAQNLPFPAGTGPQRIRRLFLSRGTANSNRLTIRGDLRIDDLVIVGRSSGVRGVGTWGHIVQESGLVRVPLNDLVLGQTDTSFAGYGNGIYEYRSGTLELAQDGGIGLHLSSGTNSITADGMKAGPGGVGKFVVYNPASEGHVRIWSINCAAFAGFDEGILNNPNDSVFDPLFDSNGETTGVGIFEFHYTNGGTRPIQVNTGMILNNGLDNNTKGSRSSRLDLVLDAASCDGVGCVPNNIGLFDVGYSGSGSLTGFGDLDGDGIFTDDRIFSNADGTVHFREGDLVSAVFGRTQYNWTISYSGRITWLNADSSLVSSITGFGTGNDIVLIGHSSVRLVPEPSTELMLFVALLCLLGRNFAAKAQASYGNGWSG